ncbi:YheC/YheD family protein [Peribacillus aracenensis]|uniref:YheC/YheD family protein n=1 Tax=Peribacillus aracenensis TaxID=2976708 RepID=UPI0021A66827|nr:YheC/YheD family protein [Peribacillus sp. BBB004]
MDIHKPFNDKMRKTLVLLNDPLVKDYIPVTDWFTERKAKKLIKTYPSLFIKPNKGRIGIGVMRLRRIGDSQYEVHYQDKAEKYETIAQGLAALKKKFNPSKKYLIQQGIDLATVLERPFDFRVVMHKFNGKWERSGWCAKISPPKMIVTNHAKGGIIISAEQALAANKSNFDYNKALNELNEVCHKICSVYDSHFSFCKVGLDMAIDKNGHIWFIEANTSPDQAMFRKLGDQRIYKEIKSKDLQIRRISKKILKDLNHNSE